MTTLALTLPEDLLLLRAAMLAPLGALRRRDLFAADEPLAAARLVELVLAGRIAVERRGRFLLVRDEIVVIDDAPTGDPLLDDVLERVATARVHTCASWITRLAEGSRDAYWDRLVAASILRPDPLRDGPRRHVPDADAVAAAKDRVRAVLAAPEASAVRDVALVALLVHTQDLSVLLHELRLTPAGLVRAHRASRRDDGRARQAIEHCRRSPAGAVADAVERIARAAAAPAGA